MHKDYDPKNIEQEIQNFWEENQTFLALEDSKENSKEKFFCLAMLPYPSGNLHMGHVRNYTLADFIAQYQRMLGKNVLHPMAWDAFGLPAENAALKNKLAPSEWTYANIKKMRTELRRLGFSYDWSREITTCAPEYYRWTQWIFLQLFNRYNIKVFRDKLNYRATFSCILFGIS